MAETPSSAGDDYHATVDAIRRQLAAIVSEPGPFSESTDLTRDVQIDSASTMDLVFELEEQFDIAVPLNDLGDVRTVGDLAALVVRLREHG